MNIILALIVFGLIVTFHEFGHFSLAKLCGIRVLEFSVGMGPKIASFVKRGTRYSLRMLPLGGYCSMLGEDTDAEDFTEGSLNAAPVWKRILIVAAGPMFNFILAFLLAVVILSQVGVDRCVLTGILEGYPAENSGIRAGDEIIRINDHRVVFFRDLTSYLYLYPGKEADVTVRRESDGGEGAAELKTFHIAPMYNEERDAWMLGIEVSGKRDIPDSIPKLLYYSGQEVRYNITMVVDSLKLLVRGLVPLDDLTGPVGIVSVIGESVEETRPYGAKALFLTLADIALLLSANLGVMNLLPIPALDGGRLLFFFAEAVTGRHLDRRVEGAIHFAGLVLLMGLMIFLMMHDFMRLMSG